ncbi:MAG: DUF2934 domain-containing protein [Deinococcales bacterium]
MLRCYGDGCPLKTDCYRYTQPSPGRDAFVRSPFDPKSQSCEHFYSNEPSEALLRSSAYYLYVCEGKPEGQALRHWQEAYLSLCRSTGKLKGN